MKQVQSNQDTIDEIITNVVKYQHGNRKTKYHLYRMFGLSPKIAAESAGYNKDYAYKMDSEYKHNPDIRQSIERIVDKMPERYRQVCKLRLAQISEIEAEALREYQDNPKLAIDKPQLLKQVKQGASVLSDEEEKPQQFINIKSLQQLSLQILNSPPGEPLPETIENAEIIEPGEST